METHWLGRRWPQGWTECCLGRREIQAPVINTGRAGRAVQPSGTPGFIWPSACRVHGLAWLPHLYHPSPWEAYGHL